MAESAIEGLAEPPAARANPRWAPLRRAIGYARPYLGLILLVAVATLVFSAGRYGRAYLMKPLLDGVLMPAAIGESVGATASGNLASGLAETLTPFVPDRTLESDRGEPTTVSAEPIRQSLAHILLAALAIVVVTPLALFAQAYGSEYVLGRIHLDVQRELARKVLALPLARHRDRRTGDLLTRVQVDAQSIREIQKLVLQVFLVAATMIVIGVSTLAYISLPLTLISLLAAPPIAWALISFGRVIRRRAERRQARLGDVTQRLVGILSGIKVIKTFGGEATEARAFARESGALFRADMGVVQGRVLSRASVEALNSLAGFAVLTVGAVLVLQGRFGLTAGDVAAFGAVLATTYKPIKNASKGFGRLMEQLASGERLMEVLDAEEERADPRDATPIERLQSQIRFEDVTLVHAGRGERREVIRGLDLTLRRGEVVAVVGRTGSGKTSLVDLTIGLYPPTRGRISIDERPLQEIASRSWRDRIAVVEQDAFLFDTSIAENIRYGLPDASDDAVLAAARAAHVDEFVDALPAGFDTEVGEFGLRLSGGQRQRIAIARALLRQPDVLIFDEATSALDPKTERTVQEAIAQLRGDRLILMVSHRLASVRDADRILVMEDGRIVEDGPHQALLERSELYRELART